MDRYAASKIWKQKWNDFVMIIKLKSEEDAEYVAAMIRYTYR